MAPSHEAMGARQGAGSWLDGTWELWDFRVDQATAAGAKLAELGLLKAEPDLIRAEHML